MEPSELLNRNSKFKNKYFGKRCFVVGNGPSLKNIDLAKIKNDVCIVGSGFFNHPLASLVDPEFYAFADPSFFSDSSKVLERQEYFKSITSICKSANYFVPFSFAENLNNENILPYDKTYFVPFGDVRPCRGNHPDFANSVPPVWNVAELAIMLAMYLGCSPIYLIGIDHDWLSHRGEDKHFYEGRGGLWEVEREPTNLSENSYQHFMETILKLWKGYEGLLDYANSIGTRILNATQESFLDVFEFQNFNDIFNVAYGKSKQDDIKDTLSSVVSTIQPKIARCDYVGAYQCTLRAINRDPSSSELLLLQCDLDLMNGNFDNVCNVLSEIIANNNRYIPGTLDRAVALWKSGSQTPALNIFGALYSKFNQHRDVIEAISDVLIASGQLHDAQNIIIKYLDNHPNDVLMQEKINRINLELNPVTNEDLYDIAYRWGWNDPELRQLVYLCYKTPDLVGNARRYSMSEGFKEAVSLLISFGKKPGKDIKILDLGCGNGVATYALARLGYSVTGLDSSLGELAGLKAAAQLNGLDGVEFSLSHSTGEFLDFPDEVFDIIWMREVLHHIHDLESFMKEAARILKPDGVICCLREHVIWNENQREHFFRTHPFFHITKDEGCYYLNEYIEAFSSANLSLEMILGPTDSVINTYPASWIPGLKFDPDEAKKRTEGNDLFSFFARKPLSSQIQKMAASKYMAIGNSVILDSFNLQVLNAKESLPYLNIGNDCMIGAQFEIVSPGAQIVVGDRVYISSGTRLICVDNIEFGNDILVAWGCLFMDHDSYPVDAEARKSIVMRKAEKLRNGEQGWDWPQLDGVVKGKITIGDNAWIGMNCVIHKGVTIGEGAVVSACSVVTEDVEPWSVVIGNPARRII